MWVYDRCVWAQGVHQVIFRGSLGNGNKTVYVISRLVNMYVVYAVC